MSATATAQALVHFLWQGALVGLAAWIALSLLERATAATRYAVALGALLLMAILPFATAFWLAGEAAPSAPSVASAAASVVKAPALSGGTVAVKTFGASLLPWVFYLWLAGVAALSLIHLGGFRRVRHLSRQGRPVEEALQALARDLGGRLGIRRAVALLESAKVSVPATVGWLRPVVLVPASAFTGLSPRQLEAILAHELAHVRRHDYLVNLFQAAVETLLFYHPAVWWVSAQVRRERENCCDDLAVAVCGDRLGYARALVDLEGLRTAAPRLALAASGGSLSGRVRRLLGSPDRSSRRPWAAGLLALALLPAGAVVQTACSSGAARQGVHGDAEAHQTRTWSAERQGDKLRLTLKIRTAPWSKWTSVDDYPLSELAGLAPGKDVRFDLRRSAGTIHLQGDYDDRSGHGTFTFAADPALAREIGAALSDLRLLELAVYDIPLSYVREMRELGYARPAQYRRPRNIHEMVRWRFRDFFGHGSPSSLQQLEELRTHGVTPEYVRGLQAAGYRGLASQEVVELRIHGIEPGWVQKMSATGYRRLFPFELVELHQMGISPEWLRGIVQVGYGGLVPDQLVSLHTHGIDGDAIRRAGSAGGRLPPDELVSLQARGMLGR